MSEPIGVLVAAALAVLLAAFAAELVARSWIRRRTAYYVHPPGLRLLLHPHPEVFPQLERSVRFEINDVGERGEARRQGLQICLPLGFVHRLVQQL